MILDPVQRHMKLKQLATIINGELIGSDLEFKDVSLDSRTAFKNSLYVAIKGDNFDGHEFIESAIASGSVAAIVSQDIETTIPVIKVEDTRIALGLYASYVRQQYNIPFVALTGSCGKTTVKEMIATVLSERGPTLYSQGSFNNDIGVPLTLLRLSDKYKYAVIEMGANHLGEIANLSNLVKPNVALVNNIAGAHLEGFGDIHGVAAAKGEIFKGLHENGTAIFNIEINYPEFSVHLDRGHKIMRFGNGENADISARVLDSESLSENKFVLVTPEGEIDINLPLPGEHNILNALAVSSVCLSLGFSLEEIKSGLSKVKAVAGRLKIHPVSNGLTVIDDTYNANPYSMTAAIKLLARYPGERTLILGDMRELGKTEEKLHYEMGERTRELGIDRLFTCGDLSKQASDAFGEGAMHFATQQELIDQLKANYLRKDGDRTVLIKGSRGMQMEHVVSALHPEEKH